VNDDIVQTLQPEELNGFLSRTRKGDPLVHFEHRLADDLRDILRRAGQFVPAHGGAVLLDDPRAKRGIFAGNEHGKLTVIACFGCVEPFALGARFDIGEGFAGGVYTSGDASLAADLLGVPIVIGESTCGVLLLRDAADGTTSFTERHLTLLRVFGDYISSTVQNALDAHKARELLRRDSLTGLYNDRYLYPRLEEEIVRAESEGSPLALLFIDLDDFKKVNDRFGHLAGSRTLREVALVFRRAIPPGAIAVRYGGDEFVVLLPGADARVGRNVGEALRQALEATSLQLSGTPAGLPRAQDVSVVVAEPDALTPATQINVTCSVGVAAYHEHLHPLGSVERRQNALLYLADTAMYLAKMTGKNQVRLAAPEL
jgi:diguanylate cyclase (GGDEF)-like protein